MRSLCGAFIVALAVASAGLAQDHKDLQHDWKVEEKDGEVNFISNHKAPVTFSSTGEPEGTLSMSAMKFAGRVPPLSEVVTSEIEEIRKGLEIGPYMEEDGKKVKDGIASWIEEIDGQRVAFIKYRTVGLKGEAQVMPRTVRHAILVKSGRLYFVHLTVLFAGHQEEMRGDQMRLVKGIIRKK